MSPTSKREYLRAISQRYRAAARPAKHQILTEVCATTGYHRKAVIRVLNRPPAAQPRRRRRRAPTYGAQLISVLAAIWEAAGYPCQRCSDRRGPMRGQASLCMLLFAGSVALAFTATARCLGYSATSDSGDVQASFRVVDTTAPPALVAVS